MEFLSKEKLRKLQPTQMLEIVRSGRAIKDHLENINSIIGSSDSMATVHREMGLIEDKIFMSLDPREVKDGSKQA